jgi:hypothetical protein
MKCDKYAIILFVFLLLIQSCTSESNLASSGNEEVASNEMYVPLNASTNLFSENHVSTLSMEYPNGGEYSNSLEKRDISMWEDTSGAKDISVYNGVLYKICGGTPDVAGNYCIAKTPLDYPNMTWQTIPGMALRLDAGPNNLWVVQKDGNIHKYNFATGLWQMMLSGYGRDVAVNKDDGTPAIIFGNQDSYGNYPIYQGNQSGTSWTAIGAAYRISVSSGKLWVIQWNGNVHYYDGTWHFVGNPATSGNAKPDIAAASSGTSVAVVGKDGVIYTYGYRPNYYYQWTTKRNTGVAVAKPGMDYSTCWVIDDDAVGTIYSWEPPVSIQ